MTIFLRALYGPFGRGTDARVGRLGTVFPATQVDWHFFGIREDNSVGRWVLRFKTKERTFVALAGAKSSLVKGMPAAAHDLALADAFVPDKPMVYGQTYLDILKPRLSKDDIAFATRLAIEAAR